MIDGVRASDPRRRRAQWASAFVGDLVVDDRVEIRISDHCEISKEHVDIGGRCLCPLLPMPMPAWVVSSPRTRLANIQNSASFMRQL